MRNNWHFCRQGLISVAVLLAAAGLGRAAGDPAALASLVSHTEKAKPSGKPRTFTTDVAPILFQNCVVCHRPGEAAPFPLMTYEQVRKRGRQITEVTDTKLMPPWHAEQ